MKLEGLEFSVSKSVGPFEGIEVTVDDSDCFCIKVEIDGCGIKTCLIVYMSTTIVINCGLTKQDRSRVRWIGGKT